MPDRTVQVAPDALVPRGEFNEREDGSLPLGALRIDERRGLLLDRPVDHVVNVVEVIVKSVARNAAGGHDIPYRNLAEGFFLRKLQGAVDDGAFGKL